MTNEEIAQIVLQEAQKNDKYRNQLIKALKNNDEDWLKDLIREVLGIIVRTTVNEILNWLRRRLPSTA